MEWKLGAAANLVIAVCYLTICAAIICVRAKAATVTATDE